MMQGDKVSFRLGEKKRIIIRVTGCNGQPFEITSAKYVLSLGKVVEVSGECDIIQIDDSVVLLSAVIQPQAKNSVYTMEFTYEIPPEILKHVVKVGVY